MLRYSILGCTGYLGISLIGWSERTVGLNLNVVTGSQVFGLV
jgi:hypothetical protein